MIDTNINIYQGTIYIKYLYTNVLQYISNNTRACIHMYKHIIIQGYKHGRINVCLILHVFYDTLQTLQTLPVSALFKTKKKLKNAQFTVLSSWTRGKTCRYCTQVIAQSME